MNEDQIYDEIAYAKLKLTPAYYAREVTLARKNVRSPTETCLHSTATLRAAFPEYYESRVSKNGLKKQ